MKATVIRGGKEQEIEARDLVPGDIVRRLFLLSASCNSVTDLPAAQVIIEEGAVRYFLPSFFSTAPFIPFARADVFSFEQTIPADAKILCDYSDKDNKDVFDRLEKLEKQKAAKKQSGKGDDSDDEDDDDSSDAKKLKGSAVCSVDQSCVFSSLSFCFPLFGSS
jgi:H+-transporting ATPase